MALTNQIVWASSEERDMFVTEFATIKPPSLRQEGTAAMVACTDPARYAQSCTVQHLWQSITISDLLIIAVNSEIFVRLFEIISQLFTNCLRLLVDFFENCLRIFEIEALFEVI